MRLVKMLAALVGTLSALAFCVWFLHGLQGEPLHTLASARWWLWGGSLGVGVAVALVVLAGGTVPRYIQRTDTQSPTRLTARQQVGVLILLGLLVGGTGAATWFAPRPLAHALAQYLDR